MSEVQAKLDREAAALRQKNREKQARFRAIKLGYNKDHAADMARRRAEAKR